MRNRDEFTRKTGMGSNFPEKGPLNEEIKSQTSVSFACYLILEGILLNIYKCYK